MPDLVTQTRDYLDAVRIPVEVDSVINRPLTAAPTGRLGRGPLVALAAAVMVALIGFVAILLRPGDSPAVGPQDLEEVVAGSEEGSYYVVGLDGDGVPCARAGAISEQSKQSQIVCGDPDQVGTEPFQLVAAAFQGETSVALAGWVPASVAGVTAVFDGGQSRPLELTAIPGYDLYGFGAIEKDTQVKLIELEVRDETGEIIKRYFPSIGRSD